MEDLVINDHVYQIENDGEYINIYYQSECIATTYSTSSQDEIVGMIIDYQEGIRVF